MRQAVNITSPNILVSACLLGEKVRYDGQSKEVYADVLRQWRDEGRLIVLCPEMAGGLPVPRPAAEIQGDKVISCLGDDVTDAFVRGANKAVALCQAHHIRVAILKEGSPSCGLTQINDGTFQRIKIAGQGMTTKALEGIGVRVFNELQLDAAKAYVDAMACLSKHGE